MLRAPRRDVVELEWQMYLISIYKMTTRIYSFITLTNVVEVVGADRRH